MGSNIAHCPTPLDPDYPHGAAEVFKEHGIAFTSNPLNCDLFVASHGLPFWWKTIKRKAQLLLRYQFRRRFLIWSDEPWNTDPPLLRWSRLQPPAHVMNIYSGDVLLSNFHFADWSIRKNLPFKRMDECPLPGTARIVGLVGYVSKREPRVIDGVDHDLNWLRMAIMTYGHEHKRADIYGANWPEGMSKQDSRAGNWWDRKLAILKDYDICLAMENTTFPYYCTEKLWQALAGGCLPIYYGKGNRIYDTFPKDSFIDTADFTSVADLYRYIAALSQQEYFTRYNRCIEANNSAAATFDPDREHMMVMTKIVDRIKDTASNRR
jgi:hypothetical protein